VQRIPTAVNFGFLDRSRYFSIQVIPQLSSRGWVDPVPDRLFLRKSGSAGNRTRDLWMCSQELWPLDHWGVQAIFFARMAFSFWYLYTLSCPISRFLKIGLHIAVPLIKMLCIKCKLHSLTLQSSWSLTLSDPSPLNQQILIILKVFKVVTETCSVYLKLGAVGTYGICCGRYRGWLVNLHTRFGLKMEALKLLPFFISMLVNQRWL
jgi:hypothetical protein